MQSNFGFYYVSSDGHIYDTVKNKEVPIWKSKLGYCNVSLYVDDKRRIFKVHRLVALIYVHNPNPDEYDEVNHIDGNKENNDASNLEWSNSYLNNKHARETGLNDISRSNRERWNNKEFSEMARKNMSEAALKRGMAGMSNPNFKLLLEYKGEKYLLKDFAPIINLTYSGLYQKVRKCLDNGISFFVINGEHVNILKG